MKNINLNKFKLSIITIVSLVCLCALCIGFAFLPKADERKVLADEYTVTVTDGIADKGFYMEDGAEIRLLDGKYGVKFTTCVEKGFYNYLTTTYSGATIEFFTLYNYTGANVTDISYGAASTRQKKFNGTIEYEAEAADDTVFNYYFSLIYNGASAAGVDDATMQLAISHTVTARACVKVTPTEGDPVVIYAKCEDTARSLRGVANAAYLDKTEYNPAEQAVIAGYLVPAGKEIGDISETNGGYYGETYAGDPASYDEDDYEKQGDITVAGLVGSVKAEAYIDAKKVTASNSAGVVTISGYEFDKDEIGSNGADKVLTVFDTAGNAYRQTIKLVTRIITVKEDLMVFNINNTKYTEINVTNNATAIAGVGSITGYYVLGNDIDASGDYIFETQGVIRGADTSSGVGAKGFNGTFDGAGHIIKSLTFGNVMTKAEYCAANNIDSDDFDDTNKDYQKVWRYSAFSLFGIIGSNGTVKNFAMTDVKFNVTWDKTYYAMISGLAGLIVDGATVKNVYIDIASVNGGHKTNSPISGLAYCVYDGANVSNVIVDSTAELCLDYARTKAFSFIQEPGKSTDYTQGNICDNYCVSTFSDSIDTTVYSDLDAMATAGNDYSSFSSDCWHTVRGIKAWNGVRPLFSSNTYEVDLDNAKTALSANDLTALFGSPSATLVDAESATSGYTVSFDAGAIGITKSAGAIAWNGETINAAFYNADYGEKVTVRLCTKVITQASDLAVFNMGTYTNSYAFDNTVPTGTLTGYYVLDNNIDASGYTFDTQGAFTDNANCTSTDIGFRGTFDGRGYTISGITFGNVNNEIYKDKDSTYFSKVSFSLFGVIGVGATVKNFGITGVKFNITRDTGYGNMNAPFLSPLAMYVYQNATVENVYIDIAQARGGHTGSWATSLIGFAYRLHPGATVNNVIIDTTITDSDAYDASRKTSFVRNLRSGTTVNDYDENSIANTYIISDFTGSTDPLSSKVSIYADVAAMNAAGNNYSSFSTDYWDTTSGIPVWKTAA